MPKTYQQASEAEATEACKYLRTIIEAAENSNQSGENAAVRAAEAVRFGEDSSRRNMLAVVMEADVELIAAVQQMIPADDKIICDHVREAHRVLSELLAIAGRQERYVRDGEVAND